MSDVSIDTLIALVSLLSGVCLGGYIIAHRVIHTLEVLKDALADGKLSEEEVDTLIDEFLSYRGLFMGLRKKV